MNNKSKKAANKKMIETISNNKDFYREQLKNFKELLKNEDWSYGDKEDYEEMIRIIETGLK